MRWATWRIAPTAGHTADAGLGTDFGHRTIQIAAVAFHLITKVDILAAKLAPFTLI